MRKISHFPIKYTYTNGYQIHHSFNMPGDNPKMTVHHIVNLFVIQNMKSVAKALQKVKKEEVRNSMHSGHYIHTKT